MDEDFDIKFYRERWKAVEEIERQELRAMTIEKHWKQINNLVRFALENGLMRGDDDNEMEVFLRWAKLKELFEQGKLNQYAQSVKKGDVIG
jgi:hypothetical protein